MVIYCSMCNQISPRRGSLRGSLGSWRNHTEKKTDGSILGGFPYKGYPKRIIPDMTITLKKKTLTLKMGGYVHLPQRGHVLLRLCYQGQGHLIQGHIGNYPFVFESISSVRVKISLFSEIDLIMITVHVYYMFTNKSHPFSFEYFHESKMLKLCFLTRGNLPFLINLDFGVQKEKFTNHILKFLLLRVLFKG